MTSESPIILDSVTSNSTDSDSQDSRGHSPSAKNRSPHKRWGNCPPDSSMLPPCRVCGEKASGLHYGVNTCEPCKGFFRRCIVKMKKSEVYRCSKEGNCKLGGGKRLSCSACRYKKCLVVGMSHEAIKIGRYTHEKRTKDIKEIKSTKTKEINLESRTLEDHTSLTILLDPMKQLDICVDETEAFQLVENLIKIQGKFNNDFKFVFNVPEMLKMQQTVYETYKQKEEMFGSLGHLPSNVYDEFYNATGIDIDDRQAKMTRIANHMDNFIRTMVSFARSLPGFSELSTSDQMALLKAGYSEYWFLEFHRRVNPDLRVIAVLRGPDGDKPGIHQSEMMGVIGAHQSELLKFTGGVKDVNIDYMFDTAASLQKCNLSMEEATLCRGIVLTFTDQCELQDPDKVEKIQWHLINCLKCVLRKTNEKPEQRLWQIFDKFPLLRTMASESRKLDSIKAQWPVMKNHPLVLEIIDHSSHK